MTNDLIGTRVFKSFLKTGRIADGDTFDSFERNVRNWVALLIYNGYSQQTVKRYLGKIRTLNETRLGDSEAFDVLFDSLREFINDKKVFQRSEVTDELNAIRRFARSMDSDSLSDLQRFLLCQLYSGALSISDIFDWKFNDRPETVTQVEDIIDTMPTVRRTYIFRLNRHNRMSQEARRYELMLTHILSGVGCNSVGRSEEQFIREIWIAAAIQSGVPIEKILGIIGSLPESLKCLNVVRPVDLSDTERIAILQQVADSINPSTPEWYAMYMRDRNSAEMIKAELKEKNPQLNRMTHFFSPTYKVYEKSGRKLRVSEVPFLPHILFFRVRPDRVKQIASIVGQLAWVFKTANRADAPYSSIPRAEMERFQQVIGVADDSMKIDYVANLNLEPDRRVIVTGGTFKGYEGTIYKTKGHVEDSNIRIFTLKLNDECHIKWEVSIEECFLQPID